jgi:hypothetical protein
MVMRCSAAGYVVSALAGLGLAADALACAPGLADATRIESARYVLAFRTQPRAIQVGEHFSLEVAVCARAEPVPIATLKADAHMPEHRHGMNYTPRVLGSSGRYRVTGFLFHMPGRWEYVFEVTGQRGRERLTHAVVME